MTLSVFFNRLKPQEIMKISKNQLFVIDFKILNFFGNWPGNFINLRCAVIFISSFLLELFPEVYFVYENWNNVLKIFMCLHEFITVIVYVIKMSILLIKRKKIMKLVDELKEKWAESIAKKFMQKPKINFNNLRFH